MLEFFWLPPCFCMVGDCCLVWVALTDGALARLVLMEEGTCINGDLWHCHPCLTLSLKYCGAGESYVHFLWYLSCGNSAELSLKHFSYFTEGLTYISHLLKYFLLLVSSFLLAPKIVTRATSYPFVWQNCSLKCFPSTYSQNCVHN